jgi:hypothetical protein
MKLEELKGQIVDVISINGTIYSEVELVDIDERSHGVFIRDNPLYGSAYPEPYFVSSIAEIKRVIYEDEVKELESRVKQAHEDAAKKEATQAKVSPVRKSLLFKQNKK